MWELVRLSDGKWSVRFEGEEKWILPSHEIMNPIPWNGNAQVIEPWQAIQIQRMLNNLRGLRET